MRHWIETALVHIMACHQFDGKPLRKRMLGFCQLWNKLQWNLDQNIKLLIQENAPGNIVSEMAAILPRGRWVNTWHGRGMHSMHIQLFPFHLNFVSWCHRDIRGSWGKLWVCMYWRAQQIFGQCDFNWSSYCEFLICIWIGPRWLIYKWVDGFLKNHLGAYSDECDPFIALKSTNSFWTVNIEGACWTTIIILLWYMLLYMLLRHWISVVGEIDSFIFALMAAHLLLISTASSANVYMNIIASVSDLF